MIEPSPLHARRERTSSFVGAGCFIQAAGLLAPFVLYALGGAIAGMSGGIVGVLVGLVLLLILMVVGSRAALKYRCGNCKNPLANSAVRVCPVCKADLS